MLTLAGPTEPPAAQTLKKHQSPRQLQACAGNLISEAHEASQRARGVGKKRPASGLLAATAAAGF